MIRTGYTLIELVIVIALLAIILLGGSSIFFRNLRSNGVGNVDLAVNSEARTVLSLIEKDIRFSRVVNVDVGSRADCINAGGNGYSGNSLTVDDLQGLETVYSLDSNRVASISAKTGVKVYLTSKNIKISSLAFTWYCQSGISDKIKIDMNVSSTILGSALDISRTVSREINLLNSGIN